MKKVLILYGWHGSDAPHWQSWLKDELEKENYEVCFPQLSDNLRPKKDIWMKEALNAFNKAKPDIVITHSMGNTLWFHLCNEKLLSKVKNLLLVAPPRDLNDFEDVKSFFPVNTPHDLYAKEVLMVSSDNDPYMDIKESQKLSDTLGCELKVLEDAGHINADSGYGPWPWVLEWTRSK